MDDDAARRMHYQSYRGLSRGFSEAKLLLLLGHTRYSYSIGEVENRINLYVYAGIIRAELQRRARINGQIKFYSISLI